jgi:uncharacterized protein YecT (DUF1311 family)
MADRRVMMPLLLLALVPLVLAAAAVPDPTTVALQRCLDDAANASTAGQTQCEADAARAFDRRMNIAYATLMRKLPPAAAQRLRLAQRAWLTFRSAEADARGALYATRQGTMYVPMAAGDATNVIRDRAVQLEAYRQVLRIEQ